MDKSDSLWWSTVFIYIKVKWIQMHSTCKKHTEQQAFIGQKDWETQRILANRLLMEMRVRDGREKQAVGTCDCESRQKLFPDWAPGVTTHLHTCILHSTFACWFVPAQSSVQFCSWRNYRSTCFVLSLSTLHCPALSELLHSVSCWESWPLRFFTPVGSGGKLLLLLALPGTALGTAFLHLSVAQAACWHHCSVLGCQVQRKSPESPHWQITWQSGTAGYSHSPQGKK